MYRAAPRDELVVSKHLPTDLDGLIAGLDTILEVVLLEVDRCWEDREHVRDIPRKRPPSDCRTLSRGGGVTSQVGERGHVFRVQFKGLLVVHDGSIEVLLLVRLVTELLLLQSLLFLGQELRFGLLRLLLGLGLGLLLFLGFLPLRGLVALSPLSTIQKKKSKSTEGT